jgi:hypothetical protein
VREKKSVRVNVEHAATTALAKDATTFAFAPATPNAVIDVMRKGVFEALTRNWAFRADPLRNDDTDPVTRKARTRWVVTTLAICHPLCAHGFLPKPKPYLLHSSDR